MVRETSLRRARPEGGDVGIDNCRRRCRRRHHHRRLWEERGIDLCSVGTFDLTGHHLVSYPWGSVAAVRARRFNF